jgi:hypothetical protein
MLRRQSLIKKEINMFHIIENDNKQLLSKIEIDTQISTAKTYPRDINNFIPTATILATMDQETADSCFYCLPRTDKAGKKTEIKGASIRLAEIALSCWGNMHAATRIIENDGKTITAQAVAWDLQSNVKITTEIKRSILTRDGKLYNQDMQVMTGNAASSIALRNAILKVVPKALIDRVYEAAVKFSIGDQKTISAKRDEVFKRFNNMGVDKEKIFSFFKKNSIEEFEKDDLTTLIGIGTAIKDNMVSIDNAFSLTEENEKLSAKERLDNLKNNGVGNN